MIAGFIAGRRDPDEWYVCVEARELTIQRAPRGTASRNFFYPCYFRDGCVALAPDSEGVWGKFPALTEISRPATTA